MEKFKSISKVKVTHERGVDFIQTEGIIQKTESGRVYLKGLMYNFNIS